MSNIKANFTIQSIGYYTRSKAVYLTAIPESSHENQKISILLDKTESNLEKLAKIIAEQATKVKIILDPASKTLIPDKIGRDTVRFRGIEIETICEPSNLSFFSQVLN